MPTIYCPHCGYNLTGLAEHRCPECGREYEPAAVTGDAPGGYESITLHEILYQIGWPPGLFLVTFFLGPFLMGWYARVVILAAAVLLVFYGFENALALARRMAVTRALKSGTAQSGLEDWGFIVWCTAGLYICQIAIGFGVWLWYYAAHGRPW